MNPTAPEVPAIPSAADLALLRRLPSLPPVQLQRLQERCPSQSAPDWLRLVLALHAGLDSPQAEGLSGSDLVNALESLGRWSETWDRPSDSGGQELINWYGGPPSAHLALAVVTVLGKLGITGGWTLPTLVGGDGYCSSMALALRWLEGAAEQMTRHPPPERPWSLAETVARVPGTTDVSVRVLLQAGPETGALGHLRLRAVHEPGAYLRLVPTPGSVSLLLDASFGAALETVTDFLRRCLSQQVGKQQAVPLLDIALAWDLAPAAGEHQAFACLLGNSAGAAFACAALQTLAPYAGPALRQALNSGAMLLPDAFFSAAIDSQGQLHEVGGLLAKEKGFAPLAEALSRWLRDPARGPQSLPLYLASQQQLPTETLSAAPTRVGSVFDILHDIAQRAEPMSDDQQAFINAGFANPQQLAQALREDTQRVQTEELLNQLVDGPHINPVRSAQQAAIQGVARWVRQAGGSLRHQFVPVQVQTDSSHARRLTEAAREPHERLVELLRLADRGSHLGYTLTGPPGAGKTVLLRQHMLACCESLLSAQPPEDSSQQPRQELPIYLPLDGFTAANPPEHLGSPGGPDAAPWWAEQARLHTQAVLRQQGWQTASALWAGLFAPGTVAAQPWSFRVMLDGLNELPLPEPVPGKKPQSRSQRARWVVQGFLDTFRHLTLKLLLSVRTEHFQLSDDFLRVNLLPWQPHHVLAYMQRFFGKERAQELWPGFEKDPVLLDLCSRPMHLHMQCELIEHGYAPLATDRASLYLAHFWWRLRRGLGLHGQRETRRKPDDALSYEHLLSERDRERIEGMSPGQIDADDLRELPTEGLLVRGLMQQAESQYWSDVGAGKDSGARCSVSVNRSDIRFTHADGTPVDEDLRDRWIDACDALGLLEKQKSLRVKFSHQSWGEFFASLRLLDTPPDELERQAKAGAPGAQAKWDRAMVRPFRHLGKPVSAETERQALSERVNRRWAVALPLLRSLPLHTLPSVSGRWLGPVPLDEFKADATVNMAEASDEEVQQRFAPTRLVREGALRFDAPARCVWAGLDAWVVIADIPAALGLAPDQGWADVPAAWQALVINNLFSCFENRIWQHLRAGDGSHPAIGEDAERGLREQPAHMDLPATSDVQEVLTLALQGLPQTAAEAWLGHWCARLPHTTPQAWRVLVPAALALRDRLEPPDGSGRITGLGLWQKPDPLLQHLRRWLLLASTDAGAAARERLRAAGLLAALEAPIPQLPSAIEATWATQVAAAVAGEGLDLLLRLQAGLLLGELGDNIRYERWPLSPQGQPERVGIRLRKAFWADIPASGPQATHRIGDTGRKDSQPVWPVPAGALRAMRFAQTPAVVMQWQAYVEDMQARQQTAPALWAMGQSRFNNPLQPITTLDWFTARAFTAWMAPLHADMFPELNGDGEDDKAQLALPTEVQHEAAVRLDPEHPHPMQQAKWPHDAHDKREPNAMPPDLFNHNRTRWRAPAPVGVFSAAFTPTGIEAMGNVWTWCANEGTDDYRGDNTELVNKPYPATSPEEWRERSAEKGRDQLDRLALRGGSFDDTAGVALAAYRYLNLPGNVNSNVGLRWQMSRPISEP